MMHYIRNSDGTPDYIRDDHPDWSKPSVHEPKPCPIALTGGRACFCARTRCEWWKGDEYTGECAVRALAATAATE